jgi:hypothetical protein
MFTCITLSCKKLADAEAPYTSINGENVYRSDATAIAVLTGLYANTSADNFFAGPSGISMIGGLSADELTLFDGIALTAQQAYYTNNLIANNQQSIGGEYWSQFFNYIFRCNAAIDGLTGPQSATLTPNIRQQLLGEAKFMRAFYYLYLVAFYGDVPLILTTDYRKNAALPRTEKSQIYQQIINDLKDAQQLLNGNYLQADLITIIDERVRPTKWAATALLARAYLYTNDWANAASQASLVIQNTGQFNLPPLKEAFLKNNNEAIWQLQTNNSDHNTEDAWTFIIPSTGPDDQHPVYLSSWLLGSFEPGDLRRSNWIDSLQVVGVTYYYPYKYKSADINAPSTEYLTMLRLGEQYLIRAEARAHLGDLSNASADLNAIRSRAGLPPIAATRQMQLLDAIQHERRVELFTEGAHRWLDLKRTNTIDEVMSVLTPLKGGSWESGDALYPLPFSDIQKNRNLAQNPHY